MVFIYAIVQTICLSFYRVCVFSFPSIIGKYKKRRAISISRKTDWLLDIKQIW